MKKIKPGSGFTLIELTIVLIIIGVLSSLALPRLFNVVEFSRTTEAMQNITVIKSSISRCHFLNNGDYDECPIDSLDMDNPSDVAGAHFTYFINTDGADGYTIVATRNTLDGGNEGDLISLEDDNGTVTRSGTGAFKNLQ